MSQVPVLHAFWDVARYWSKIADLNLPHLYLTPPLRVISLKFRRAFWRRKTRAIFVELRLVTDRQTDRRTDDDSIYRASIASCCKNATPAACMASYTSWLNWYTFLCQISAWSVLYCLGPETAKNAIFKTKLRFGGSYTVPIPRSPIWAKYKCKKLSFYNNVQGP